MALPATDSKTNKNGTVDGKTIGVAKSASSDDTRNVSKFDVEFDREIHYEFGGPVGVTILMIFFPLLMYYFWVCLEYHQGRLIYPTSLDNIVPFVRDEIWVKILEGAYPTLYAAQIYLGACFYT